MGAQCHVLCFLSGLFPAPEARVQLELGGRKLDATITHGKDAVRAMASVRGTVEEEGAQQLVCAVLLGNRRVEATANVTVYSFPAPNLTLSEPEVSEGTEVVVECEGHNGTRVSLDSTPAWPPSPRAQLRLNASAEDNGRRFSCSAALDVAGQVLRKNQTRELRVLCEWRGLAGDRPARVPSLGGLPHPPGPQAPPLARLPLAVFVQMARDWTRGTAWGTGLGRRAASRL